MENRKLSPGKVAKSYITIPSPKSLDFKTAV